MVSGDLQGRFTGGTQLFGHLFSGRYKALIVDGSGSGVFASGVRYRALESGRAKLLVADQELAAYPWSSYGEYLKRPGRRVRWLRVERLLARWGFRGTARLAEGIWRRMELRRWKGKRKNGSGSGGAGAWGQEIQKELLARWQSKWGKVIMERSGRNRERRRPTDSEEELRSGVDGKMICRNDGKEDPGEAVKLALRLRRESDYDIEVDCAAVAMGSWTNVSQLPGKHDKMNGRLSIVRTDPFAFAFRCSSGADGGLLPAAGGRRRGRERAGRYGPGTDRSRAAVVTNVAQLRHMEYPGSQ